ncbi:hypothetical protein FGO68_gene16683 [Halteria grandinella]|uniref:EF-hand domain-containing protein n=1 Tax=Halteria grandinella TaxID=5974 RepID=A0A8J8T5B2_HALGN|nr:hypothetical protein FGO68_gene16683 [Halteria grandinella]
MDAFHLLDANSKGWITSPELYDALQELGHHAHKELVFMFVRHFDRDNDGKLLYSDFCDAFSPKSNQQSVILGQRRAYFIHNHYHRLDFFSYETRDLFFRLFKLYFQHEETAELLRNSLQRRPYFNIHDAFAACDADKNGMISREELRELMIEYGIHLTELELTLLIDRYDKNHDGRISYSEFMDELMPRSAHHAR